MELVLKDVGSILNVSDAVFSCNFNKALVHQVVVSYLAGSRQGTRAQKSRAEIVGSGRKPWRQKGTGRARSGSVKSPIWRSGGVTFAARPQNYNQKVNKKMYRGAIRNILSELVRQDRIVIVEKFSISYPKTKLLIQKLKNMALEDVLIIISEFDKNLFLAAKNLYKVDICKVININPVNLIVFDKVMITIDAIKQIEEMFI